MCSVPIMDFLALYLVCCSDHDLAPALLGFAPPRYGWGLFVCSWFSMSRAVGGMGWSITAVKGKGVSGSPVEL